MKAITLLATLAATSTIACAAATVAAAPATPNAAQDVAQLALQGLALQLQRYADPAGQSATPSAAQLTAVQRVFGSVQPIHVEKLPAPRGQQRQQLTLPAASYAGAAAKADWDRITWMLNHSADGRQLATTLTWPRLSYGSGTGSIVLQGASAASRHQRGKDGLWFGTTRYTVDTVRFAEGQAPVEFIRLRGHSTATAAGKLAHQANDLLVERVKLGEYELEALHAAWQLRNLDRATLARMGTSDGSDQQLMLAQLKQLLLAGAQLRIDDLSARFKGHTASLRAAVALPGATADDLASAPRVLAKLELKTDVTVPLGLIRELAAAWAGKMTMKEAPNADALYKGIVDSATGQGWCRVEGNALRSTIEWNKGKLVVNGKPFALPEPLRAVLATAPAPAAQ